jgi:hypothetical protein
LGFASGKSQHFIQKKEENIPVWKEDRRLRVRKAADV